MKLTPSRLALLAFAFLPAFAPASHAQSVDAGEAYAERHCNWCHGQSGQSYSIAPKLAGQRSAYIQVQLQRFWAKKRDNPYSESYMWHVARPDRKTTRDVALYFAKQFPEAANNGNAEVMSEGKRLYDVGAPTSNVASCAFCHGPAAQGVGTIPRIGGMSYHYLKRRLQQWGEGYDMTAAHMPGIAIQLSARQIEVLSSYLSFVR